VLQYHFNWHTLAAIAGVSWWKFYFQLHPGAIRAPQVVAFLTHLLRHVRGTLLIVWDKLPAHKSHLVRDFLAAHRNRLTTEFLPSYAPELNPTEYLWGHWKQHELPNFCPQDFAQLSTTARHALRRMRRRPSLIAAFWQQADLFDCHYITCSE
jgi:transposase